MEDRCLFDIKYVDVKKVSYDNIRPCFICERRCIGLFFVAGNIQKYMTICMHCQLLGRMGNTAEEAIQKWNRQEYTYGMFLRKVKPAEHLVEETGREDPSFPYLEQLVSIKTCKRTFLDWSKYYD